MKRHEDVCICTLLSRGSYCFACLLCEFSGSFLDVYVCMRMDEVVVLVVRDLYGLGCY